MSLLAMPTDVQDRDLSSRKRSHGDFMDQEPCGAGPFNSSDHIRADHSLSDKENDTPCASRGAPSPAAKSSTSSLSELACSPPAANSPSPGPTPASPAPTQPSMATATAQQTAGEPPKKRKRATAAEKAARDAARDAAMEIEKRKKQEEKERKKREKEEAEKLKAQQKAAKAEEKAAKAAEKAEKEQEKKQRTEDRERRRREKEEEEAKKSRGQMKLTSMFGLTATTPKKDPAVSKANDTQPGSATKGDTKERSLYEQMFNAFFVKENVRLARNPFEVDEETRQAKTKILEEYLSGERPPPPTTSPFAPLETLQIPYKVRRGRVYPSVKKIMEGYDDLSSNGPIDSTTESQKAQLKLTLDALKLVPLKTIKFREDVRPPYVGTISGPPPGGKSLSKLARRPISKDILPLNYDYDSEAEWQEEEGEDVDDLDDEEEEADGDEDMADFLDDSEDVGPARMVFSGGMEPESIGPCWEDRTRKTAEQKLYKYRLEFILEPLDHHHSIDPFSTAYWETPKPSPKPKASASTDSSAAAAPTSTTAPSNPPGSTSAQDPMAPPPAPSDAFQALGTGAGTRSKKTQQPPLPPDMQQKLKDLVRSFPNLSKIGVIELFAASNPGCPKAQIKTSFDALFEKAGKNAGKVFKVRGE